ncbi:condensin-2 complex subunit H2 [Cottoperca gobio]|uniref:Condensin-2 complex subunit H2 n=1 Tax=Cottoperca gobio TaxID=56716 RepID=A0A6J2PA14_COTGO|nr:condensin-2 complex subunit H2 [Cottoperca gobio]XP_029282062.1 condensin-2 complex subunit H2 [Cottoperca gobio]XP_029282063.1 condensin-2 complex subunit H2 [Cottoperca gobio]
MESTESRFPHLLQPIRELTKNWEIDVASELNDYLEELDDMCITYDGGKIQLNFAEAALLIQGSACIYSKKVELLHSLVYQTLEYINDKKKRNKRTAASQEDDANGESSHDAGDVEAFSPLDAQVPDNTTNADSSTMVSVAPLPPETLIPPEATEKHKLPLISVDGDVLCSQKDFQIVQFVPGLEDLILLGSAAFSVRLQLDARRPARFCLLSSLTLTVSDDAAPVEVADVGDHAGDAAAENFLPLEDNNMELDHEEPEEHVYRHQAPCDGGRILRRPLEADTRTKPPPPAVNAWTLHDPYAVLGEDRPFKPGKCYKVPDGLDDAGKRKRKRVCSLQDFRSWFSGTFDPPDHKLKNGPTFADLNYIYLSTMKDRLKSRRRVFRSAGVVVSDEELMRTFLQPEEAGPQQQGEEPVDGVIPPDLLGGDDDNSDNEYEAFPDDVAADFVGGADFISPDARRDELSYEDLVKLRVEQLVVNCRGYTQETALSRRVKDWEDKIRPVLVQQEDRSVFDIHDYGDRIVGALHGVGQRRAFSSIVTGLDNFEACKYLLATLQLANDYTVEVHSAVGLEESVDSVALTLLSTHRATDRFKAMTASTLNH